jgi:hypothetical protein
MLVSTDGRLSTLSVRMRRREAEIPFAQTDHQYTAAPPAESDQELLRRREFG